MERDQVGPGARELRDDAVDGLDHQVHVDRDRDVRTNRRAHQRPRAQVRHVVVVHHVEVNQVRAGRLDRSHLFAEAREISREIEGAMR
jgi:hypothetical protein